MLLAAACLLAAAGVSAVPGASSAATPEGTPVIMAAGDVACDPATASFNGGLGTMTACRDRATSDLIVGSDADAVLPLGDLVYKCGSLAAFQQSYDLSWGRVKGISFPVIGNNDYGTSASSPQTGCNASNADAAGYFGYWGAAAGAPGKGWYSFDLGSWHVVVLNSNCNRVGCGPTSEQGQWLREDLAAHQTTCTLAAFHHPLFVSGGGNASVRPFWDMLYAADVDVALTAHAHRYERFAPLTSSGALDWRRGIREFVVGTGGAEHHVFTGTPAATSEALDSSTYGVLRLELGEGAYSWEFLPEAGRTYTDSGTALCDEGAGDVTVPSTPTGLTAETDPGQVRLTWQPATDDTRVVGYRVRRDGIVVGTPSGTSFTDTTSAPATSYRYTVTAYDAAGNESPPSEPVEVLTPATQVLTFTVGQDGHVNAGSPGTAYPNANPLLVDGSPRIRSFLRFALSGIGGRRVVSATLRLYTANGSPNAGSVFATDGRSWTEGGLTWNTQPGLAATPAAALGAATAGTYEEADVTSLVTGDGVLDLALVTPHGDSAGFTSGESGTVTRRPVLRVLVE